MRRRDQFLKLRRLRAGQAEARRGPAIFGRLRGQVFQFATSLRQRPRDPDAGQIANVEVPELFATSPNLPRAQRKSEFVIYRTRSGAKFLARRILDEHAKDR